MNAIPIALFWLLAIWGLLSKRPVLLYLFFATIPIGAFAVIPTAITGGLTFTPTPILTLLLVGRCFFDRAGPSSFISMAIMPRRLMLLALFWLVAAVTTAFMPRLFAGDIMVVPYRGILSTTTPLRPTAQDISRLAYVTIAVLSVFAFARLLRAPEMRQHALQAVCLGGGVTVVTGLLDYASTYLPIKPLLEPFRTASYSLLTDWEVLGSKRVVGLMPEASSYGGTCLAFLSAIYFYRRAIVNDRIRKLYAPALLGLLLLCCWLSTSSGTYVGVAVFGVMVFVEWFMRINADKNRGSVYRQGLGGEMSITVFAICAIAVLVIVRPDVLDPIYTLVDRMVLQKTSSDSYHERGMWRTVALNSLKQTYGLGVGLGGTRASSSIVSVFSGAGILGGLLFYGFVLQSFMRNFRDAPIETQLINSAFRLSFIPSFVVAMMVGDADFSGLPAFGLGIVSALAIPRSQTTPRSAHTTLKGQNRIPQLSINRW